MRFFTEPALSEILQSLWLVESDKYDSYLILSPKRNLYEQKVCVFPGELWFSTF